MTILVLLRILYKLLIAICNSLNDLIDGRTSTDHFAIILLCLNMSTMFVVGGQQQVILITIVNNHYLKNFTYPQPTQLVDTKTHMYKYTPTRNQAQNTYLYTHS